MGEPRQGEPRRGEGYRGTTLSVGALEEDEPVHRPYNLLRETVAPILEEEPTPQGGVRGAQSSGWRHEVVNFSNPRRVEFTVRAHESLYFQVP